MARNEKDKPAVEIVKTLFPIKPGNLMVDLTGKLWVTDFGLARIESDPGMTMTG